MNNLVSEVSHGPYGAWTTIGALRPGQSQSTHVGILNPPVGGPLTDHRSHRHTRRFTFTAQTPRALRAWLLAVQHLTSHLHLTSSRPDTRSRWHLALLAEHTQLLRL